MLAFSAAIVLACGGGGTAIKPDNTTVSGEQSGSYDYGRGSYDGTFSGTAVFSVLVEEWPRVREGLLARLEEHGPEPVVAAVE